MNYSKIFAIALIGAGVAACSEKKQAVQEVDQAPTVELGVANRQDVPQTKTYTANVDPYVTNNISPSMANRIKEIRVDVGDRVSRGQTLVTLDRSNSNQLKLALDNAKREYQRALQLKEIGAGTQQAVDQLKTQVDSYQSQYDNMIENTILNSPSNGVVISRNYDPGDMTGQQPVLTIGEIDKVKVMINITEGDYAKVRSGMPVSLTFDALPDEAFEGKIERIYPTVDRQTRTFQAEIQVNNPAKRILPGMFARVVIDMGAQNHVVVPDRAIVKQPGSGNKYVYTYNNGKVSYNRVELGQRMGDVYELLSGIEEGDSIVIAGQSQLADGVEVQVLRR